MINSLEYFTYCFDSEHKASIGEEDDKDRNEEVDNKHVNYIGLVVEAWGQSVVVRSARALDALREVSVS